MVTLKHVTRSGGCYGLGVLGLGDPAVLLQFHAMDTLHKNIYDISRAISALVPQGGPVLCRDEMEEWSASEANLFEEALEKYGKDFTDIQQDFVSALGGVGATSCAPSPGGLWGVCGKLCVPVMAGWCPCPASAVLSRRWTSCGPGLCLQAPPCGEDQVLGGVLMETY